LAPCRATYSDCWFCHIAAGCDELHGRLLRWLYLRVSSTPAPPTILRRLYSSSLPSPPGRAAPPALAFHYALRLPPLPGTPLRTPCGYTTFTTCLSITARGPCADIALTLPHRALPGRTARRSAGRRGDAAAPVPSVSLRPADSRCCATVCPPFFLCAELEALNYLVPPASPLPTTHVPMPLPAPYATKRPYRSFTATLMRYKPPEANTTTFGFLRFGRTAPPQAASLQHHCLPPPPTPLPRLALPLRGSPSTRARALPTRRVRLHTGARAYLAAPPCACLAKA